MRWTCLKITLRWRSSTSLYSFMSLTKEVLFIKMKRFFSLSSCYSIICRSNLCIFCGPARKAKLCLIDFPRLSFCLSKLLSMGQVWEWASEEGKWVASECLTAWKHFLIVRREQQIGLSYKTLIDLWKVEVTARSLVPMLNCTPVLRPYEALIIKENGLFSSPNHWMTWNQ